MAFDRYCTVCANTFTTFVGKYRSSPAYLTTVSQVYWTTLLDQIIGSIWVTAFAISWPVSSRSKVHNESCGTQWAENSSCEVEINNTTMKILNPVRSVCSCGFTNAEISVRTKLERPIQYLSFIRERRYLLTRSLYCINQAEFWF